MQDAWLDCMEWGHGIACGRASVSHSRVEGLLADTILYSNFTLRIPNLKETQNERVVTASAQFDHPTGSFLPLLLSPTSCSSRSFLPSAGPSAWQRQTSRTQEHPRMHTMSSPYALTERNDDPEDDVHSCSIACTDLEPLPCTTSTTSIACYHLLPDDSSATPAVPSLPQYNPPSMSRVVPSLDL